MQGRNTACLFCGGRYYRVGRLLRDTPVYLKTVKPMGNKHSLQNALKVNEENEQIIPGLSTALGVESSPLPR